PRRRSRARPRPGPPDDRRLRGRSGGGRDRQHLGLRGAHEGVRPPARRRPGVRGAREALRRVGRRSGGVPRAGAAPWAALPGAPDGDLSRPVSRRARPEAQGGAASAPGAIPGLRIVELTESDWCCGSAGIYNLTQPEMATRLLQRKVSHVLATGADAVVTAN